MGFENRHTMSSKTDPERGIGAAREYILETFRGYGGRLQPAFDSYLVKGDGRRVTEDVDLRNVVAVLPGSDPAGLGRVLMVGGHYDSSAFGGDRSRPIDEHSMPGADDDGSGTVVAMELARIMADYPTEATIIFVGFAGEELGLVGSTLMAQRMAGEGANIEAMITNDIVGSPLGGDGELDATRVRVFSVGPADSKPRAWARYIRRTAATYSPSFHVDTIFRYDRFGRGGDHTPFVQEGYAGVRINREPRILRASAHSGRSARIRRLRLPGVGGAGQRGSAGVAGQRPLATARQRRQRPTDARARGVALRRTPSLGGESGARRGWLHRVDAAYHVAVLGAFVERRQRYRACDAEGVH